MRRKKAIVFSPPPPLPSAAARAGHHAHASSHHLFSSRTCASSSGVKSLTMLNVLRISSAVFPCKIAITKTEGGGQGACGVGMSIAVGDKKGGNKQMKERKDEG